MEKICRTADDRAVRLLMSKNLGTQYLPILMEVSKMFKKLARAFPALLFTGVAFLSGCNAAPSNPLLGKWEAHGALTLEFTETEAILPDGSCPVEGYTKEMKQIDGKKFLVISYKCVDEKNGSSVQLAAMMVDDDTLIAFSDVWHRLK